jgi:hypothetical protein
MTNLIPLPTNEKPSILNDQPMLNQVLLKKLRLLSVAFSAKNKRPIIDLRRQ